MLEPELIFIKLKSFGAPSSQAQMIYNHLKTFS